jgi:hypothetical protein
MRNYISKQKNQKIKEELSQSITKVKFNRVMYNKYHFIPLSFNRKYQLIKINKTHHPKFHQIKCHLLKVHHQKFHHQKVLHLKFPHLKLVLEVHLKFHQKTHHQKSKRYPKRNQNQNPYLHHLKKNQNLNLNQNLYLNHPKKNPKKKNLKRKDSSDYFDSIIFIFFTIFL